MVWCIILYSFALASKYLANVMLSMWFRLLHARNFIIHVTHSVNILGSQARGLSLVKSIQVSLSQKSVMNSKNGIRYLKFETWYKKLSDSLWYNCMILINIAVTYAHVGSNVFTFLHFRYDWYFMLSLFKFLSK